MSSVAEISQAIAQLSATEQLELLRSVSPHLKVTADDVLRNITSNGSAAKNADHTPGARSMLGFAKQFHPEDRRNSDEILRELREGETN